MRTKHFIAILVFFFTSVSMSAQIARSWIYCDDYGDSGMSVIMNLKRDGTVEYIWSLEGDFEVDGETIDITGYYKVPGTYSENNNYLSMTLNLAKAKYEYESGIDGKNVPASWTKKYNSWKADFKKVMVGVMRSKMSGKYWIDGDYLVWKTTKNGTDVYKPYY